MLGFGALLKYMPPQRERQKAFISNTSQVAPMVTKYTPTVPSNNEEESAPAQLARMQNSEGKVPPSDIQAESLQILIPGIQGNYLIDASSTLIAKIYFKKKQFVWEFVDVRSTDPSEKNKKKRIEVKFGDIISMILVAKEGQMGSLTIETNRPLTLVKEKNTQPGKNTQWAKTEDFTNGFSVPKDGKPLRLVTTFQKDVLTKRAGKYSHLDKLLSSDTRLRQLMEQNPETSFDIVRIIQPKDNVSEPSEEVNEDSQANLSEYYNQIVDKNLNFPNIPLKIFEGRGSAFTQEFLADIINKPVEDLIEMLNKELKPKSLPSQLVRKYRFKCPACKCPKKFNSDTGLREHMHQRHRNLVDLGLDVLPNGMFKASKTFLINVLT